MAQIVQYTEFGGPEVLELVAVAEPRASVGEVVVAVRAAGLRLATELAAAGRFAVEIAAVFPLAEAAEAQELSEHGHPRGTIVLLP